MAVLVLLLLAAPIPPEKLGLLPRMWPEQRIALEKKVRPVLERGGNVAPVLVEAGVDPRVLELISRVEPGPLLQERYARRLVWLARDLTSEQRTLFETLIPGVDGAQLALDAIARTTKDDAAKAGLRQRIRAFEQRYWRIVGYALTPDQRRALRKLYPERHADIPDLPGHIYRLKGMTPSQANRIRALVTEFESESAADQAEGRRLRAAGKHKELREVELRQSRRTQAAYARGRKVLTPEQNKELDALVPFLTPALRRQNPGEIVKKMNVRKDQMPRLKELGAGIEQVQRRVQARVKKKQAEMDGIGEDSPQMAMMQMMHLGAQAELIAAFERAAHEAVNKILTPGQILGWIVGG